MKRIISALLILIIMIPPMVLPAHASTESVIQPQSKVWLEADKTKVSAGDEVTVSVNYENIPACGSFDFSLVYDPQYFETVKETNLSSNITAYGAQNVVYTMEEPAELAGKKAVKLVGVSTEEGVNCLPASGGILFTVKFVLKEGAPNPSETGIPLEFLGSFYNLYSGKDMRNTIEVVNTHITTAAYEKSVASVALSRFPNKREYVQGQALNMEGGRLLVTYNDGSQEEVRLSMAKVARIESNPSDAEKQTVVVTYAGNEVSFEIQIKEKKFTAISVGQEPKAEYTIGTTALERTGGILLLHYNTDDGTGGLIETLDMTDSLVNLTGYDPNTLGVQTITVQYGGFETHYKIAVVEKALKKIDVRTPMICSTCNLEMDALALITNAGGTSTNKATFSSRQEYFEKNKGNIPCLNSECSGKTFTPKMKMVYYLGENFDVNPDNVKLYVTYTDNTTEELTMDLDMVEFNNTIPTTQYVEVTYGSKSTSIPNVQTKKKGVKGISIHQDPKKLIYIMGQPLDTTGGEILVTYEDDSEEVISMGRADVGIYYSNLNEAGDHRITVQYRYATASFKIHVDPLEIVSVEVDPEANSTFVQGQELYPYTKLNVTYNDGKIKTAYLSDAKITEYDAMGTGPQLVTATYGGKTFYWPVTVEEKVVTKLDLVGTPPQEIVEGKDLTLENCTLTATYNGGKLEEKNIPITPDMITFESEVGLQTVTITYTDINGNKKETTFSITVCPKSLTGIEVVDVKDLYLLGEDLDRSVGQIKLIYDNGTDGYIDFRNEDISVEGFSSDAEGEYEITVSYQGFTTSYTVTVHGEIKEISVTPPAKTEYKEGEPLDLTGGKVEITYYDDTPTESLDLTLGMISGYDPNQPGDQTLTVTLGGKTATFTVTVKEKQLTGITVSPATIDHNEWEEFDLSKVLDQVTVTAWYDYGDPNSLTLGKDNCEYKADSAEVVFTYEGKTATLSINVIKRAPISIEWKEEPQKRTYFVGDPLLKDGTIYVRYNDPSIVKEILVTDEDVEVHGDTATPGTKTVYVQYKDVVGYISFEITVDPVIVEKIEITAKPNQSYIEGEPLNPAGGTILVTYNNKKTKSLAMDAAGVTFSGYDPNEFGEQTVTVSYEGQTATFTVNVQAKTAKKIQMTALPQISYLEGKDTALNLAGGKITVFYNNNTSAVVPLTDPLVKVSGFDKTLLGKQTITVSYPGVDSVTFTVTMNQKKVSGIELAAMPSKTLYRQGVEKFDPTGGLITVFYNNDTKETVDLSAATISGYTNLFAGDVTVTAAYEGYAVEFKVMILAENPFKDVKANEYYETPVLWAMTKGITTGVNETSFAPDNKCTRSQIVTFLWRTAGEPEPKTTQNPFVDIKPEDYYYKAVLWAVENGITTGTSATTFNPGAGCTRGQVATFLWRAKNKPSAANSENPFTDLKNGEYYYDAVLWAVEEGITKGVSEDRFAPNNTCTRGQIVTFLYRAYESNR